MKILAVISLGFGIGSGHLSRTLKLISQFKKKNVLFIFNQKEKIRGLKKNFNIFSTNFENKKKILNKISNFKPDLIILDSYVISYDLNQEIYKLNKNIISIDDNLNKKHICKYYINYNFIDKKFKKRLSQNIDAKKKFIGPKYFFANHLNSIIKKPIKNNVLIFLGSTNENNILGKILPFFKDVRFYNFKFEIILGRFNDKKYKNLKIKNLKIYKSLPHEKYLTLLSKCDFFISSGGVSVWEGLSLKKKMLVISTADNQLNNLKHLKKNKLIKYVGSSKKFNVSYKEKITNFFFNKSSDMLVKNIDKFEIAKKFKFMINVIKRDNEV